MSDETKRAKATKKAKLWSKSIGGYGSRIRLYEMKKDGMIYWEHRQKSASLRHNNKKEAERWAMEQVSKWMAGRWHEREVVMTCKRLFAEYREYQTPDKSLSERKADERRSEMWKRWLGEAKDMSMVTLGEWNGFIKARTSGAINAAGKDVPEVMPDDLPDDQAAAWRGREIVKAGTVAADLVWLRTVLNWATKWQGADGRYLLRENCTRGFKLPKEKNPRRVVISHDRFLAVRAVADQVMTVRGHRGTNAEIMPSYLPAILDLAEGTGRRISAILKLQYRDLQLHEGEFGSLRWVAANDKCGKEWTVPMTRELRAVIDVILRDRPGIGEAYLFPAINDPSKPVAIDTASGWLSEAERLAGLSKLEGSRWHCFRRKWAMERKGLSITDTAASGGWSDPKVLLEIYQQPDPANMRKVMTAPTRLREVL